VRLPTPLLRPARKAKALARQVGLVAPLPTPIGPVRPDVELAAAMDIAPDQVWRATRLPQSGPQPWLDRPGAEQEVSRRLKYGHITAAQADLCRHWIRDGYVIVPGLIDQATLDEVWFHYEERLAAGAVETDDDDPQGPGDMLRGRALDPHLTVPQLRSLLEDRRLVDVVELLLGAVALPFQTIAGHKASQQALHSDSIHMTTYPLGYLVANWIAFEDISADSGPLRFVPGSHRLDTLYADEVGIDHRQPARDIYGQFNVTYSPLVEAMAEAFPRRSSVFTASAGDVLFWHANLLHGGSMRTNYLQSRRAVVCHYFAKGCVCYHDLTGILANVDR